MLADCIIGGWANWRLRAATSSAEGRRSLRNSSDISSTTDKELRHINDLKGVHVCGGRGGIV